MFLNELVKSARVVDGVPSKEDVTLILAECRPGVDYSMVVSREVYESILIKYRASEPGAEAILMSIGKGKDKGDPVWDIMLQNEIVASQYSMLCSDFHAARLGLDVIPTETTVENEEPKEPIEDATELPEEESTPEETPEVSESEETTAEETEETTEKSEEVIEDATEESEVEEVEEAPAESEVEEAPAESEVEETSEEPEPDEDVNTFFNGVTDVPAPVNENTTSVVPAGEFFETLDEVQGPATPMDLLAIAQAACGIRPTMEDSSTKESEETELPEEPPVAEETELPEEFPVAEQEVVEVEKVEEVTEEIISSDVSWTPTEPAEQSTEGVPEIEDDDYFPKGIRPEEEDRKALEKKSAVPLDAEGEEMLVQATKILSELGKVFFQFGEDVVCRQALSCSFSEFRISWSAVVPGIASLDSEQLIDVVRERVTSVVNDKRGDERFQQVNEILSPAMKILYEE